MKKSSIIIIIFFLFAGHDLYASDERDYYTSGRLNGYFALNAAGESVTLYMGGLIDGIKSTRPYLLKGYYAGYSRGDIRDKVLDYYKSNPAGNTKPIVDILLSGCTGEETFNVLSTEMTSNGYKNGNYLLSEEVDYMSKISYIEGVCDTIAVYDMELMAGNFPDTHYREVLEMAVVYYESNPSKRKVPIIEVVKYGCK